MEPRGCNWWQKVANRPGARTPEASQKRCLRCERLPAKFHGKQGICRGLPPVAGGPLPAKEGVDLDRRLPRLLLAAALGAWALVAAAAGACLADHGSILLRCSFGRLRA